MRDLRAARGVVRDPWEDKQMKRVDFPRSTSEALQQAADAVDAALDQGVHRLRLQLNLAQLDLYRQPLANSRLPSLINSVGRRLVGRGLRVCFLFNTLRDASEAKAQLSQELLDAQVGISVLGLGDFGEQFDAAVLVCASNEGDENLQRIECVERLIYAGPPKDMTKKADKMRFLQRPIILINPQLEAIHSMSSAARKVKPMFMSDFQMVYFLQPHFSYSNALDAALFRSVCQVPGTWQVWVREFPDEPAPLVGPSGKGTGKAPEADSTFCSVQTNWGGHQATFTLIWEKPSFPSEMDLAFLMDFMNADWVQSAAKLI